MGDYVFDGLLPGGSSSVSLFSSPEYDEIWSMAESRTAELLGHIQPSRPSEERRKAVIDYVKRLIERNFDCKVFAFGSVPLKTYLPNGDIDLTAFSELYVDDTWPSDLCGILEDEERSHVAKFQVKEVKCIHAEVPVVKCLVENIIVDITFNQIGGLSTLCFLEEVDRLIGHSHLFKRSLILVKAWCFYESRILGATHGLLSTYALETLVLYVFHVFHWSLRGPLEVLFRFLEFFSKFDWKQYCLTLWGPIPLVSLHNMAVDSYKKHRDQSLLSEAFLDACREAYTVYPGRQGAQGKTFSQKFMNVLDPLRSDNNLGRSVNKGNFVRIHSAFAYGAGQLEKLLKCPQEFLAENLAAFFRNTGSHCRGHRPDAPDLCFQQFQVQADISSCCDKVRSKHTNSEGNIEPKVDLKLALPQQEYSSSSMQNRLHEQMLLGNAFGEIHLQADNETKSIGAKTLVSDANILDITASTNDAHRIQDSGQTMGRRKKKGKCLSNSAQERLHNVDMGSESFGNDSISNSRDCLANAEDLVSCQNTSCNCDFYNNLRNNTPFEDLRNSLTNSRTTLGLGPLVSFENKAHISQEGVLQKLHDVTESIEGKATYCMDSTCGVVGREIFSKPYGNLFSMEASLFCQEKHIDGDMKCHNTLSKSQIPHALPQDSSTENQSPRDPGTLPLTSGVKITSRPATPCHPGLKEETAMVSASSDSLGCGEDQQALLVHQGSSKYFFQSVSHSNIARKTDFDEVCVKALVSPHGSPALPESIGNEPVWFTTEDDIGGSETSLKALEQEVRSFALEKETKSQRLQNGDIKMQEGIRSNSRSVGHANSSGGSGFPDCVTGRTLVKLLDLSAGSASEVVATGSHGQQLEEMTQELKFILKELVHKHPVSDFNSRSFDSNKEEKMDLGFFMNGIEKDEEMTTSLPLLDSLIEERDQIEPCAMQLSPSNQPSSLLQTIDNMYYDSARLRNLSQKMNTVLDEKAGFVLGCTDAAINDPESHHLPSKDASSFSETVVAHDTLCSRGINIKSPEEFQTEEREVNIPGGDFANCLLISEGGHDEFSEIRDTEADILTGDFEANLRNLEAGRCFQKSRPYGSIPSASSTIFHRRYIEEGSVWEGTGRTGTVNTDIFAQISSCRNGVLPVLAQNGANVRNRDPISGSFLPEGLPKFQKGTGTFFPTVRGGFDRERRLTNGVRAQRGVTSVDFRDPGNQNGTSACRLRYHGQKKRDVQNKFKSRLDRKSIEIKAKERDLDISSEDSVHRSTLCRPSNPVGKFVAPSKSDGDLGFFGSKTVNGADCLSKSPAIMVSPSGTSKDLPIEKLEFGSFGPVIMKRFLSGSFQQGSFVQENGEFVQNQHNSQRIEPSESYEACAKVGHHAELQPSSPQGSYQLKDEDFPPLTFYSQRERSTVFVAQKS